MTKSKKIATCGILMAFTMVATLIYIPLPAIKGYLNLGDTIIFITALCFNPLLAFFVGGIGSSLADVILGYSAFAPFTLIVKGLEGFFASLMIRLLLNNVSQAEKFGGKQMLRFNASTFFGGIFMVGGYFLVEVLMYDTPTAVAELPFNFIQLTVCMGLSTMLAASLFNQGLLKTFAKKG